jgi:hypothetical protein
VALDDTSIRSNAVSAPTLATGRLSSPLSDGRSFARRTSSPDRAGVSRDPSAWLYRTAFNRMIQDLRRESRRARSFGNTLAEDARSSESPENLSLQTRSATTCCG